MTNLLGLLSLLVLRQENLPGTSQMSITDSYNYISIMIYKVTFFLFCSADNWQAKYLVNV